MSSVGSAGIAADPAPVAVPAGARLALLSVRINGIDQSEPAWVLRDAGTVYVTIATAKLWRLKVQAPATRVFEGDTYIALNQLPGVVLAIDEATQAMALSAPAAMFEQSQVLLTGRNSGPMTRSGLGGYFNYDVSTQIASGTTLLNGSFELGAFTGAGTASTTFTATTGSTGLGQHKLVRLESNWTIDDPARMRSLRIGDGVTRGSTGTSSLRFAGLQFASNFATQPGYLTMALPTLSGSAVVPSVVDIYVNNVLQNQQKVASGPFTLTDVPVVSGSGDVQLVVRDALGRETLVTQSYYAAPQILRRGLHDFSYEIGFLRRNFTFDSNDYGAAILSATHHYGVTERVTVEGHGEATRTTQAASLAIDALWPSVGIFSISGAASRSRLGAGGLLGVGFARQARGLSIGGSGEITTNDYATIGDTDTYRRPRSTMTAFLGLPTPFGSLGGSFLWRRGRGEADVMDVTASASMRIRGLGSFNLSGHRSFAGARDTGATLFLIVPIRRRASASVGTEIRNGQLGANATLQRNLPYGDGVGYSFQAETGFIDRVSAELDAQANIGQFQAQVTRLDGSTGARMELSGSVATIGGEVFVARHLDQSFGAVQVGNYENVRVYTDNQLIGRTNGSGVLIVPRLLSYQDNHIRIEAEDIPLDATIDETQRTVRPYDRSGVAIRFGARDAKDAMLTVVLANGEPVPAGTALQINGGGEVFVVAPGGAVYLTGLAARNTVSATFNGGTCRFAFSFAAGQGPQPDLGKFTCVR